MSKSNTKNVAKNSSKSDKGAKAQAALNALDVATAQVQQQMSEAPKKAPAKKNDEKKAPKSQTTGALKLHDDGARDILKGALSSRTHTIHEVLVTLYNEKGADATMSTSAITERVNALWARATDGGAKTNNASTASHLNTMKSRGFARHGAEGRGWRLDDAAIKLCASK